MLVTDAEFRVAVRFRQGDTGVTLEQSQESAVPRNPGNLLN